MALDKLSSALFSSISEIRALMDVSRFWAICPSASQNSCSSDTLVACPAILTERLITRLDHIQWVHPLRKLFFSEKLKF